MAYFPLILLVAVIATLAAQWVQGRRRHAFTIGLYLLVGMTLALAVVQLARPTWLQARGVMVFYLLLMWLVLLASLTLDWRLLAGIFIGGMVFMLLPGFPVTSLLSWGLVTAVPLSAFAARRRLNVPILMPHTTAAPLRPVAVSDHVTAEMLDTQQPILECLPDGVLYFAPSGLIMAVNQTACQMLNFREEEMLGQSAPDLLHHLPILFARGAPADGQFELNGRILRSRHNLIYDKHGGVQGTVIVLQDVTVEQRAQQTRDQFLTTVSHELRTPLTAIKGYVELMMTDVAGPLSATQQTFLSTIQRNVLHIVNLINSLLFAASIQGGRIEYTSGYADLPRIVQQIAREMEVMAEAHHQKIKLDLDGRLKRLQIDPIHLATILKELLTNGIKYNRDGGVVTVQTVLQESTAADRETAFAVINIRDEGIGITPEDQSYIFDIFFHPDDHDAQIRSGGIGMGLSIVKALVEAYNGRIWFETAPNRGSTFTFVLPTSQTTLQNADAAEISSN